DSGSAEDSRADAEALPKSLVEMTLVAESGRRGDLRQRRRAPPHQPARPLEPAAPQVLARCHPEALTESPREVDAVNAKLGGDLRDRPWTRIEAGITQELARPAKPARCSAHRKLALDSGALEQLETMRLGDSARQVVVPPCLGEQLPHQSDRRRRQTDFLDGK